MGRFILILLIAIAISFGIAWAIWCKAGYTLHFSGRFLNLDFLNILFGTFEIVGLTIAVYELSALRSEKKIREEEREKAFKIHAREQCTIANEYLKSLQSKLLVEPSYSTSILNAYIMEIQIVVNILYAIDNEQNTSGFGSIINCEKCVALIKEFESGLYRVLEDEVLLRGKFPKRKLNSKLSEAIKQVSLCEKLLKV